MEKIKVLHMFAGNTKGGRTQYMLNAWEYIDKNRFQFDFATLTQQLDYAELLVAQGCKIHYVSCYAEENKEQFIKEIDEILSEGYDVVHIHFSFWRGMVVEECARKANVKKIILHSHNFGIGVVSTKEEAEILEKKHYELKELVNETMADVFLACSQEAADWMYGDKIDQNKVRVLKNGIDLQKYKYNEKVRNEVRNQLELSEKFVIGNIAKFVYQKNHEFLIDVFYEVSKSIEDSILLLIGVGELKPQIEEKVRHLGIDDKVIFLSKRNDIEKLLQAMDVFVLPSRFDGFPLSLIEAQAAELPCIVGNVPADALMGERTKKVEFNVRKWVDCIETEFHLRKRNVIYKEKIAQYDVRTWIEELEKIYCS